MILDNMNKKNFSINYIWDSYPIDESGKRLLESLYLNYSIRNVNVFLWDRNKIGMPCKENVIDNLIVWRIPCKNKAVGYGGLKNINLLNYLKEKKYFFNIVSRFIKSFNFNILILAEWKTLGVINFIECKKSKIIYLVKDMPANQIFKIIERYYLKKSKIDIILTHSPYFNKFYKDYTKNVEAIRILPSKEIFKHVSILKSNSTIERSKNKTVKILFNGTIRHIDNLIALSKAVELFNGEVEFHIYGSGHGENILKKYYQEKNIKFTKFYGRYEYKDTHKILLNHDFISALYPKNRNTIYAIPNKLYEAILFERPILVTKGTKNCEIVEKYKIGECIDNPTNYKSIHQSIQKLLLRNNWDFKEAKKWIRPYEEELLLVVEKTLPFLIKFTKISKINGGKK